MDRKHDGDAILLFRHEARRPIEERGARERRRVVEMMSLIDGSHVAPDRAVERFRSLATPFGRHGATVFLPNVVQYICV